MSKIIIDIKDKTKEEIFINFLKELSFVVIEEPKIPKGKKYSEFKKLYGIWKNRDIDLLEIKKLAWYRK